MTKQVIGVGISANDKKGDSLRTAFTKVNANFTELYTAIGGGAGTTDRLTNGALTVILGTDGTLAIPGGSFTKTTNNNLSSGVATQVVWSSSQTYISGAKLVIQVESGESSSNWETQVCEAVIAAKGYNITTDPEMVVYGVVHTSVAPLMTFTVERNLVNNLIEIVGTRTGTAFLNGTASLRIYSVETGTND